ncbi:hypothetical protein D3C87_1287930 [compost metagenome]
MLIETDVDQRQAGQRRAHHVQFAGNGQVHLIKTHAAHPRKVRIGQQHAASVEGTLTPDRDSVAAPVQGKALHPRVGHLERWLCTQRLGRGFGWRGTGQGFGKLADTTFDQQAPGQLDQIRGGDVAHPIALALRRQTLGATLAQGAVIPRHIAFDQLTHWRGLGLPETGDGLRGVQPGEKYIADQILPLLNGELIRPEVPRTLTVDRSDLVGQQAQVVLGVGIADAVAEPALVVGADVRHAETGSADVRARLRRRTTRARRKAQPQAQPQSHTRQAQPG